MIGYLHIEWRTDKLNLDDVLWCVLGFSSAQRSLDGVDSFITETGHFYIGTDLTRLVYRRNKCFEVTVWVGVTNLCWLWCESSANV